MSKDIIVSSNNKHKVREIKQILKGLPVNILSKKEAGLDSFEVVEDKDTLEGNAIKKAMAVAEKVEGIVIADDTGLFVDKLDGQPGVYTSRYAGEDATFKDNNRKLLNELEGVPMEERDAKFATAVAIITQDKKVISLEGECKGRIAFKERGENGFGYDPVFIVDEYNKTFAELEDDIKNQISHRANALLKLRNELENIVKDD